MDNGNKLLLNARDFTETEINEISSYIQNTIPHIEPMLQRMFPLTESPIDKSRIFCSAYRIIDSSKDLLEKESEKTKEKLIEVLKSIEDIYHELYPVVLKQNSNINYGKNIYLLKAIKVFLDKEKNLRVNWFLNLFLIFTEKHELISTNQTTGLELSEDAGKAAFNFMQTGVDDKPKEENI